MKTRIWVGSLALLLAWGASASAQDTVMQEPISVNTCQPALSTWPPYSTYPAWYPGYYGAWFGPWYGPWYGPWHGYWGSAWSYAPAFPQSATLTVAYVNQTAKPMRSVDFGLVANGILVARVRDVGTFSPGVEIKHDLPLDPNVFPVQTGLPQCTPLEISFVDGTRWSNPALGSMRRQLYEPPEKTSPSPAPTPGTKP